MKTIIAGTRHVTQLALVEKAIQESHFKITEVVSGRARGVDSLGEQWAEQHNIPVKLFPAEWDKHGKGAGYRRNIEMSRYSDALIAVWDGESKGTCHMMNIARTAGLKVFVFRVKRKSIEA